MSFCVAQFIRDFVDIADYIYAYICSVYTEHGLGENVICHEMSSSVVTSFFLPFSELSLVGFALDVVD